MKNISWDTLYAQQSPKLLAVCRRYVGNIALAEDLMHDAFMTAIQKQTQFSGKGSVEAWLRRITVNTALMHLRKNKGLNTLLQEDIERLPDALPEPTGENPKGIILSNNFEVADLLEVIDQLPEHHKVVFNLYVFEELTHKEIAQELNISAGTSKSHLARARKKIQKLLLEKVDDMNKKKKRAILYLLPFLQGDEPDVYIDDMFEEELEPLEIKPQGKIPDALKTALETAPPLAVSPAPFFVSVKAGILSTLAVSGLIVLTVFYFSKNTATTENPVNDISKTKAPSLSNTAIKTSQDFNANSTFTNETVEEKEIEKTTKSTARKPKENLVKNAKKPKTKTSPPPTQHPKKKSSKTQNTIVETTASKPTEKPAPVVIQKKVIVRDTVYQIQENNEN